MTNQEFSDEFDVLYNNITSNLAPGLDEYEKSVFLNKAQDEIVKAYFDPKSNKVQAGFDDSERRQIDFSMLVLKATPSVTVNSNGKGVSSIPSDALMVLNEELTVTRNNSNITLLIVPIKYTEYFRLMSKPYKRPLKWQAWRIENANGTTKSVDFIAGPNDTLKSSSYTIRYVKRPRPIILSDLEGVTIGADSGVSMSKALSYSASTTYYTKDGDIYTPKTLANESAFNSGVYYIKTTSTSNAGTAASSCELDPILHHEILQRAVELAKAAYTGDLNSLIALGTNSETPLGILTSGK